MPTTERIKIVGVQFAVNPNHERGTEMTAEEQQRTFDFLTTLDRKRPLVSVRTEPTNENDKDAVVVRWLSRKCGYVRNTPEQKARAHAAMESQHGDHCKAKVVEVEVSIKGWFFVEVETDGRAIVPAVVENPWNDWKPGVRPMPKTEQMLMVEDAVECLNDMLCYDTDGAYDDDDIKEYVNVIYTQGRHVLCSEIKHELEMCVQKMEAIEGEGTRKLSRDLEHHLAGMCNEHRLIERRTEWLPELLLSTEALTAWREWLHDHSADTRELTRLEMSGWLTQTEYDLAHIPAIAPCQSDDDCSLLTRAYYTDITTDALLRLLTMIIVRRRLRERLGLPSSTLAPVEQVVREEELRVVATIIDYCDTLTKVEQVETMRNFIYAHTAYLPPEVKHQVDHLTDRFLPKDNTETMRQTAEAMKEIAARPTTQNLVYPQADSTANIGCDQQQSEFKTFLPPVSEAHGQLGSRKNEQKGITER